MTVSPTAKVGVARWTGRIKPRVSNGEERQHCFGARNACLPLRCCCLLTWWFVAATLSTLDFFPTFLSLVGIPLPTDRAFDGIDISAVLFQGSEQVYVSRPRETCRLTGSPPPILRIRSSPILQDRETHL